MTTIQTFGGTPTTTYPSSANPWSTQLVQSVPAFSFFTPGVVPSAEELNFILYNAFAAAGITAYNNWHNPVTFQTVSGRSSAPAAPASASYDASTGRWWVAYKDNGSGGTGHASAAATIDGTKTWENNHSGNTDTTAAIIAHGGQVCVIGGQNFYAFSAGTLTSTRSVVTGFAAQATGQYFTAAGCWVGYAGAGTGYGAFASSDATVSDYHTLTLPSSLSTPSTITSAPAYSAQNATVMCIAYGGVASTQNPALGKITGASSSGLTVTDVTPSVATGNVITGLAYSPNDGLWGLLVLPPSGGNGILYTSPDLTTWTAVHTFTGQFPTGLAVANGVWAVGVAVSYAGSLVARVLLSADVGQLGSSSTWHFSQGATTATATSLQLFSNGAQFVGVTSDGTNITMSSQVGWV